VVTDHTRAALEGYGPVFAAREQWLAAAREYSARFDCSCPPDSRVCQCIYTPPAPHSDAHETVNRFDSRPQELPMSPRSYAECLKAANGDPDEARRLFSQDTHNSRRPAAPPALRSDAVDDAARDNRLRNMTAWCRTDAERSDVIARVAEQERRDRERSEFMANRSSTRLDASGAKCEGCGEPLTAADMEAGAHCPTCRADAAQRAHKQRMSREWKKPLRSTNQRSAGTIGYHPTDDDGDAA
jgi:predicted Zn-ribbon and HTH transcriptional regulator